MSATSGDGIKRICQRNITKFCSDPTLGWVICPACGQTYTKDDQVVEE